MFQVYCSITVDKVDLSAIYCYISTEPIFFSPRNVTVLNKDVIIWLYFERLWIFIDSLGLQDWFRHLLRLPPVLKVSAKWLKCEEDAEISSKMNRQLIWTDHLCLAKMLASAFECLCGYCSCGKYHSPGGNIDDHTYQIWIGIIGRFIFTVQTIQSMAEVHWNLGGWDWVEPILSAHLDTNRLCKYNDEICGMHILLENDSVLCLGFCFVFFVKISADGVGSSTVYGLHNKGYTAGDNS